MATKKYVNWIFEDLSANRTNLTQVKQQKTKVYKLKRKRRQGKVRRGGTVDTKASDGSWSRARANVD